MADSTVQTNIGPIVIAVTINTFLYGVCFLQFIRYFTAGHRDILATKLLVCWELAIDTCHSAIGIYTLWLFVVDNFMNEAFIGATPWPIPSVPIFSALSAVPIQIYLSYRIKTQFGNWIVFSILLVLVLSSGIMFIVMGASAIQKTTLTKMKHIESLIKSALALTAATDTSLSAVLVWCLRKRTSSRQSDHVISRLIRGAIESACTASVFGIMAVISYTLWTDTMISMVFAFPMGRVYTNAFLVTLNSRRRLRRSVSDLDPPPHKTTIPSLETHQDTLTTVLDSSFGQSLNQSQSQTRSGTTGTGSSASNTREDRIHTPADNTTRGTGDTTEVTQTNTTTTANTLSSMVLTDFESLQPSSTDSQSRGSVTSAVSMV